MLGSSVLPLHKVRLALLVCLLSLGYACLSLTASTRVFAAATMQSARSNTLKQLHVTGNQMLTASGSRFIPEGVSVYGGLEDADYKQNIPNDDAQIEAAALYWHANTVRLQVAESNLFSHLKKGQSYNTEFLSSLKKQVALIQSFGMVAVINDQTEFTSKIPNPTSETSKFWQVVGSTFRSNPGVMFDIFNEPRLTRSSGTNSTINQDELSHLFDGHMLKILSGNATRLTSAQVWNIWRNGGHENSVAYVGMQSIVNTIRQRGISNVIWVEGPYTARVLPEGKQLLVGTNLVYSIHHPNLDKPTSWNAIGTLAATHAVVDGEWAQYQSLRPECYDRAYTTAPRYLKYLQQNHIGVIAWSLQEGSLLSGNGQVRPTDTNTPSDPSRLQVFETPSRLLANYVCSKRSGEGAGQLIQQYFSKNSVPENAL
jgi:hypothetical protein